MSKITFRADDELVDALEAFDASKSEVMRDALRTFLEEHGSIDYRVEEAPTDPVDELIRERVDDLLTQRVDHQPGYRPPDVNVTIALDSDSPENAFDLWDVQTETDAPESAQQSAGSNRQCDQCGSTVDGEHAYCPNCGQKALQRLFCDCGDELRSDWSFCPGCGRRTPAADVLDSERSR